MYSTAEYTTFDSDYNSGNACTRTVRLGPHVSINTIVSNYRHSRTFCVRNFSRCEYLIRNYVFLPIPDT